MKPLLTEEILGLLSATPEGLSAPRLRRQLSRKLSQPTLWRYLDALRTRGALVVEGRGRATRYRAAAQISPSALRSRRLHESAARRVVADTDWREKVQARLAQLREVNPHGRVYHDRWQELLEGSKPRLLRVMVEDSEAADALRKESPLTTLVAPEERRRAFQSVRA